MESITNYPKLAKVRIIFYIEVVYVIIQTLGFLAAIVLLSSKIHKELNEGNASRLDDTFIIAVFIIIFLCYFGEVSLLVILYQGQKQKNHRKLFIWLLFNILILILLVISTILELVEEKFLGLGSSIYSIIFIGYRCVAMKMVYDAIQELRKFPLSVPFVQMRDCEERV